MKKIFLFVFLLCFSVVSCNKDIEVSKKNQSEKLNNLNFIADNESNFISSIPEIPLVTISADYYSFIDKGIFKVGNTENREGHPEYFQHEVPNEVVLNGFWIAKTQVTALQYSIFLNEKLNIGIDVSEYIHYDKSSKNFVESAIVYQKDKGFKPAEGKSNLPANSVTWKGATAYCEWLTKQDKNWSYRLPDEYEWEAAARGKLGRTWPWGASVPTSNHGDIFSPNPAASLLQSSVAAFPANQTPEGVFDMIGDGVGEWCNNVWILEEHVNNKINRNDFRSVRGFWTTTATFKGKGLVGAFRKAYDNRTFTSRVWSRNSYYYDKPSPLIGFRVLAYKTEPYVGGEGDQ